ncbi:MAG TPA: PAS domain S-box protein, partial [Gammaproteobacteria bacterium]|nr:PAS domain S-box protein [Gammaproteobacteria bacterium]
ALMFRPISAARPKLGLLDHAHRHYELANVMLMTLDRQGRITGINPKGLMLLRCTEADAVGKNWFDEFLPDEIREDIRAGFNEVISGKREPVEYQENLVMTRGGQTPLVFWTCRTQKDENGRVTHLLCSGLDITYQRKAEIDLETTKQRFQDYAAASSDYFWEMDEKLRFSWFSQRFTEVTGVPTEQLLGKTRIETGIPDVDPAIWARHLDDLENHRPFRDFIHPRTQSDGRVVWLSINGRPVFDGHGLFRGYRGTGSDITDLVETTRAYKESEEKYRKIFEAETAAITVFDAETLRFIDANDAATELYGYTREEFLDLTVADTSAEPDSTQETIEKIIDGKTNHVPRRLKRRKDGSIFPAELTSSVFSLKGKKFICCVARNLSTEEQQARALKESEQRFRSFAENSSAEIFIKDIDGRYLMVNRYMTDLLELSEEEVLGKTAVELYSPEIAARVAAHDKEVLEKKETIVRETVEEWPDRQRVYLSVRFPMFDALGRIIGLGGLNQEISELAEARRALQESERRFKDFAETAADYFWETDSEGRFIYLSERFRQVRGIGQEQVLGRTRREAFGEALEDAADGEHAPAIREHKPFTVQLTRQRPDGSVVRLESTGKPVFGRDGVFRGYRGSTRDITDAHVLSEELTYQATHDGLTGLLNRRAFEDRLNGVLEAARSEGSEHVMCYLDLDQFKVINDTCGHDAGDELLRQLCVQLKARVRKRDTLARLGGDEFGVLMEHCALDQADRVADALRQTITDFRFAWEGREFRIGASIGMAAINASSESIASVMSAADAACYVAKDQGRNRVHISREDDVELARRYTEMEWVARINAALAEDRFQLLYQPVYPISTDKRKGHHYELLLRMVEDGKRISPAEFFPAADRYNLSSSLDRWVVRTALRWLNDRPEHQRDLKLCAINLSGHSLTDSNFLYFLMQMLDECNVPASKLCFEVTETVAIANLTAATSFIEGIKSRGSRFALDDFGSGLSSFAYLKALPVDYLKIDGVFIRDLESNAVDVSMVKSINEIGHVMGKKTIAEFVESVAILDVLRQIGVDYAQGNALGMPAPLESLA